MRRHYRPWGWARRVAGLTLVIVGLVGLIAGAWTLHRACQAPLSVYTPLAAAQQELATAPTAPSGGATPAVGQALRAAGEGLLATLLAVKQDHTVAYHLHIMVAQGFERAGCQPAAIRSQWVKGGLHAQGDDQARFAAAGLARGVVDADDRAAVLAVLQTLVTEEWWSPGLPAVLQHLQQSR